MKTKKTNRDEVRENTLAVPMTEYEKNRIREASNSMGVSMSAFARIVLADFFKKQEK